MDSQGYAGLEDGVDYHWGELFKAAGLSTILAIGAESGSSTRTAIPMKLIVPMLERFIAMDRVFAKVRRQTARSAIE